MSQARGFISEGLHELSRRYDRLRLRIAGRRRAREREAALVALGRCAWEHKAGLAGVPELAGSLDRLDGQAGALAAALGDLEKEKARLETARREEIARRQQERQAVDVKKAPVDAALRTARARKDELDQTLRRLDVRAGAIAADLAAADRKIQAPPDPDPDKQAQREAARTRREQLVAERERIPADTERARAALPDAIAEVTRLTAASDEYRRQIEGIERDRAAAIAEIDGALARVRSDIDARTRETSAVGKAREEVYQQVGSALYEAHTAEPVLAESVAAVAAVDRARAADDAAMTASVAATAAMPPGTMIKFAAAIAGGLGVLIVAFAAGNFWIHRSGRAVGRGAVAGVPRAVPPFSAVERVTEGNRQRTVKLYAAERAFRSEGEEGGRPFVIIVRVDRNVVWTIHPATRTYTETPMRFGHGPGAMQGSADDSACRVAGEEKVGRFVCAKEECTERVQRKTYTETRWTAKELGGLVIKQSDGTQTVELEAITPGAQDPALFELPSGYTRTGPNRQPAAPATLTVRLPKPAGSLTSIALVAVAPETRRVLASASVAGSADHAVLTVTAVPQIVIARWIGSDGRVASGRSRLLRPEPGRSMNVDLMPLRTSGLFPAVVHASYSLATPPDGPGADSPIIVGVPSDRFTVTGLDMSPKGAASMVTFDMMTAAADCYDQPGGFVVVETDADALAALRQEIALSNTPEFDPATRLTDRYAPPSQFVSGGWSSDGTNVTVTLQMTDSQGTVLASKSASGPLDNLIDVNAQAAAALAQTMSCRRERAKTQPCTCTDADGIDEQISEIRRARQAWQRALAQAGSPDASSATFVSSLVDMDSVNLRCGSLAASADVHDNATYWYFVARSLPMAMSGENNLASTIAKSQIDAADAQETYLVKELRALSQKCGRDYTYQARRPKRQQGTD